MLLAYLDESFSKDWYFMAALLCDDAGARRIGSGLDSVVAKAVRNHGVPPDAELHGYELFQGYGWWRGVPPRVRISVYDQAFQVIADHATAVLLRGMDCAGQRRRYAQPVPPHSLVLGHLLERVDDFCRATDEHVLTIADEVGEQAKHREDLVRYRQHGTSGYRARKLTRIIDTLYFAPSNASRLIQAIDMVVFLYRRIECHTENDPRAKRANDVLWQRIEPLVQHRQCWYPSGAQPH
ncbi:DUF3800 domain-containing protein [Actinoplanes sp. N902-109]|uniref:DUF3800 domain-containing protein n=1 Tax=Actinoplanes sp. (strain N902-109) TaxID=649831 RepID=UPI00032937A3|nr:DUF3800 domain-containing protein [Actinoplanes sp. N902-109]AGL15780.1 hypothetical protein L083_2270 [Actinoplanes sp. N902-109]